jgi:hypothetical protein
VARKWYTDFEAPDSILVAVNKAIGRYHAFRTLRQGGTSTQVVAAMKNDLGRLYDPALADWIAQSYDARASGGRFVPPTDLQGVLNFLQIRKMCLEFVCDLVIRAGGLSKAYPEAGVLDPRLYRPGMGLYEPTVPHSMIILDIMWNASGLPERFQVAEANATPGLHWNNPVGMVPWRRTVQTSRTFLAAAAPPYKVMNFETR